MISISDKSSLTKHSCGPPLMSFI